MLGNVKPLPKEDHKFAADSKISLIVSETDMFIFQRSQNKDKYHSKTLVHFNTQTKLFKSFDLKGFLREAEVVEMDCRFNEVFESEEDRLRGVITLTCWFKVKKDDAVVLKVYRSTKTNFNLTVPTWMLVSEKEDFSVFIGVNYLNLRIQSTPE